MTGTPMSSARKPTPRASLPPDRPPDRRQSPPQAVCHVAAPCEEREPTCRGNQSYRVAVADQRGCIWALCLGCGSVCASLRVAVAESGGLMPGAAGGIIGRARASVPVRISALVSASAAGSSMATLAFQAPRDARHQHQQQQHHHQQHQLSSLAWVAATGSFGVVDIASSQSGRSHKRRNDHSADVINDNVENGSISGVLHGRLPAASFCTPVLFGKRLLAGCRDDRLYCIDTS
jgi:hypothetical protein